MNTLKMIKAFKDWFIIKAKKEGSEISVEETHQLLQKEEAIVLLDIREKEEIALGYIEGATFIAQGRLEKEIVESLSRIKIFLLSSIAQGEFVLLAAAKVMQEERLCPCLLNGQRNRWMERGGL